MSIRRLLLHALILTAVVFAPVVLDLRTAGDRAGAHRRRSAEVRAAAESDRRRVRRRAAAADAAQPQQAGRGADEGAHLSDDRRAGAADVRLAGSRINPKTNGPHRASGLPGTGIYSITLKKIADGAETPVKVPPQARISNVKFSPDGSHLAFLQTKDDAIELWVADGMTGAARPSSPARIGSTPRPATRATG